MTWPDFLTVALSALNVVLGPLMVLAGYSFYRLNRQPSGCLRLGPAGVLAVAGVVSLTGVAALVQAAVTVLPMVAT